MRRSLIFEVKAAYYDCYFLERAIAVSEENLRLLAHLEEVGRTRYRGGTGEHAPVLKAQVELGRLEDQLRSLRQQRRPTAARLNAALGRAATAPIAVPDSLPMAALDLDEEVLKARLQAANPTLQMRQVQAQAQSLGVELAGKQFYPDLTVSLDYIHIGDRGANPLMAMATLNLPLWRSSYEAGERAAKLSHQAALQGVADEENRLAAELGTGLVQAARRPKPQCPLPGQLAAQGRTGAQRNPTRLCRRPQRFSRGHRRPTHSAGVPASVRTGAHRPSPALGRD